MSPKRIRLNIVYSKCTRMERLPLWDLILDISMICANIPLLVVGDFSIVSSSKEKASGLPICLDASSDFNNCI